MSCATLNWLGLRLKLPVIGVSTDPRSDLVSGIFQCALLASPSGVHLLCLSLHSAEGMNAGGYGNLLMSIEQPQGEYSVTVSFLNLIMTLVRVRAFKGKGIPAILQQVCFISICRVALEGLGSILAVFVLE